MEPHIVVRGSAEVRVMPDRAVLQVTVEGEAGSRESAYRKASDPARQVDAVFERRAGALDRVVTAALLVQPRTQKRDGIWSSWRASRTTTVEVTDLAVVGDLIAELTSAGGSIYGPSWHLDRANPVHTEVRGQAAADARARAEAYAGALGLRLTGVAWVAEPGLGPSARPVEPFALSAAATRSRGALAAEDVIDVTPEEMTVDALVEVGFAFTERG